MNFLNAPITTVSIIFISVICWTALRFLKSPIRTSNKEPTTPDDSQPSTLSDEDFQRGQEIILKASRGQLPKEEYDDFMSRRNLSKKPVSVGKATRPPGYRRFKSSPDW